MKTALLAFLIVALALLAGLYAGDGLEAATHTMTPAFAKKMM
jgi:hypothetical protein